MALHLQRRGEAIDTITREALIPADTLLYRGTGLLAKLIRFFDGTEVNHAGLYLGNGEVGEALAEGVVRQPLGTSIGDHPLVIVRRLKSAPPTVEPVLDCAQHYLDQHERYAFEQLLLLAFLGLSRKLKVTPILGKLLRKVLDGAASLLLRLTDSGREPMICSEFVYRCHDEALQEADDVYSLRVGELALQPPPEGAAVPFASAMIVESRASRGRGVSPHSLLAWIISDRRWATAPSFAAPAPEPVAPAEIEALGQQYLEEIKLPETAPSFAPGGDAELTAAVERFALAYYAAAKKETGVGIAFTSSGPFQYLFRTAADFVTPGDLLRTDSLFTVGEVR